MTVQQCNLNYAITAAAAVGIVTFMTYLFKRKVKYGPINPLIRKEEKKVSDVLDIEELASRIPPGGKVSLCRCWRSKEWPYCDGVHKEHNRCTGDNVGPVNIIRKKADNS